MHSLSSRTQLGNLGLPTTTVVTTLPGTDPFSGTSIPARSFRIDWEEGHQYRKWVDLQPVREGYIYLPDDDRVPNVHLLAMTEGQLETRLYQLDIGKLGWWLAQADAIAPTGGLDVPGRPPQRALEMLTSRERRLRKKSPYRPSTFEV